MSKRSNLLFLKFRSYVDQEAVEATDGAVFKEQIQALTWHPGVFRSALCSSISLFRDP